MSTSRAASIAVILESVTLLSSGLTTARHVPFHGRTLTRTQLDALHRLAHSRTPLTPGRLAVSLGVTPGAVTQLLDGLRQEQLVDTRPHPDDARSRIVTLTAEAAAEVELFEQGVVEAVEPQFAELTDLELHTLAGLLDRVRT